MSRAWDRYLMILVGHHLANSKLKVTLIGTDSNLHWKLHQFYGIFIKKYTSICLSVKWVCCDPKGHVVMNLEILKILLISKVFSKRLLTLSVQQQSASWRSVISEKKRVKHCSKAGWCTHYFSFLDKAPPKKYVSLGIKNALNILSQ